MPKTFHFQLVEGYTDQELTTWVGTEKVVVKAHTGHALRSAATGNRPYTAAIVTGDHIYPSEIINPAQYNRVRELATIISRQGQASSTGGWATITDSVDKDGNPLYFEFDLAERKVGDRVLEYKWSEMTTDAATVPHVGAMRTASNDTELQNQTWSVNQGKTASEHQDNSGSSIVTVRRAY